MLPKLSEEGIIVIDYGVLMVRSIKNSVMEDKDEVFAEDVEHDNDDP